MDDATTKLGLLMESVHSQQQLARDSIEALYAQTRDLGAVVRSEIRDSMTEELSEMRLEVARSIQMLRGLRRSIVFRFGVAGGLLLALTGVIVGALVWYFLPTEAQISALTVRRDALAANIARLEQGGGRLQWRVCGDQSRLCVQIDAAAPPFGAQADYRVIKGY